jgi:23S rRNA (cytidine1920-2'-O)/16S rRNA (cytidine1409-2'-O)-methyltransferase
MSTQPFVSRAGQKLEAALAAFSIDVKGKVCADLGCSTGGFTDCLLQRGAAKVYAVDTGYGVLDWKLRSDERVVVMERTNALHVQLPELVDFISIDVGWTKQAFILPHALTLLKPEGAIVSLLKPHYEATPQQRTKGRVKEEELPHIVERVKEEIALAGATIEAMIESPITGEKGKNVEYLLWLRKKH